MVREDEAKTSEEVEALMVVIKMIDTIGGIIMIIEKNVITEKDEEVVAATADSTNANDLNVSSQILKNLQSLNQSCLVVVIAG